MTRGRLRRVAFALVVATAVLGSVLLGSARVIGRPEGELRDHLWLAWAFARAVWNDHRLPTFLDVAAFPDGLVLYPLDPLHQAAVTLLTPVFGTIGAVNAVTFALYALLVYGGQKLAAAARAPVSAEIAIGMLAAASPAFLGAFADTQTEGMASGWLLLLLAELFADRPRPGRAGLWGACLVASGPYLAHGVAVVVAITWLYRRFPLRAAAFPLVVSVVVAFALWHLEMRPTGALAARSAQVATATSPPGSSPIGARPAPPLPDDGVVAHLGAYPGAVETGPRRDLVVALVLLVVVAAREPRARLPAALATAYAAVALGHRFGPGGTPVAWPTPYTLFWRWYPMAKYAWKPAQYAVPATAFALLAVARGWAGSGWRKSTMVGLSLVALAELQVRGSTPLPLPVSELRPRAAWLQLGPGGALVEFPCRDRGVPGHAPVADVLLGPLWHGRALGETPHRTPTKAHAALLSALEGAITHAPGAPALAPAWEAAANAGFTDLLVLTDLLGPAAPRLEAAIADLGVSAPTDTERVLHYSIGKSARGQ